MIESGPTRFRHYVAIDWSGAAGDRHRGIAVAMCANGKAAPELVRSGHRWSRSEVAQWLLDDLPDNSLVGLDLGMSLPFADCGAFFPGWEETPADARSLWVLVEQVCADDPHLGANSLVDHTHAARHYRRHGGRQGDLFGGMDPADGIKTDGRGRFRQTELAQQAMGCRPYSNFNLVGAAQVGKSSLTGMRLLHRVSQRLTVWPVDPVGETGSVITEIYTTIAAMAAGRPPGRSKMRSLAELNQALETLGSAPIPGEDHLIDDHQTDALLTAAWLRMSADRPELWNPHGMSAVAQTEGWTFGAT
ncbi:MAG: hypothetical protein ABJA20_09905 [Novosphingobium sp.]